MLELVMRMHAGAENLPFYWAWIDDHMGARVITFRQKLMPQIRAFTDLRDMDVLDFGCGTGSTTVALCDSAESSRITAVDIDARSLEIAVLRLRHHGKEDRVTMHHIPAVCSVGDLPMDSGSFDFILANGVLEHVVPFSTRPQVVLEMWRLLRPGGLLFISETPNPLWPFDRHTTGLPLIPWLPTGVASRVAVALGRHTAGTDIDVQGRRGMSYWEIVRPLRRGGHRFEVMNITATHNRLLPAGPEPGRRVGAKRHLANLLLEGLAAKPLTALGIPTVALGPFIEYLCIKKHDSTPGSGVETGKT